MNKKKICVMILFYLNFVLVKMKIIPNNAGKVSENLVYPSTKLNLVNPSFLSTEKSFKKINLNESQNISFLKNRTAEQLVGIPFHVVAISLAMYSLIFIIGFFGNALVIFVVCWNKSLQHNTNYCLVNLSVADLLLIVVCMPVAVTDIFAKEVWYFGFLMC